MDTQTAVRYPADWLQCSVFGGDCTWQRIRRSIVPRAEVPKLDRANSGEIEFATFAAAGPTVDALPDHLMGRCAESNRNCSAYSWVKQASNGVAVFCASWDVSAFDPHALHCVAVARFHQSPSGFHHFVVVRGEKPEAETEFATELVDYLSKQVFQLPAGVQRGHR